MPNLTQEMSLWYGGNTYACVRPAFQPESVSFCGQIVPPSASVEQIMQSAYGSVQACVRTENLQIICGGANKLYTPNFFLDNWGWFAVAIVIAYVVYRNEKENRASKAS